MSGTPITSAGTKNAAHSRLRLKIAQKAAEKGDDRAVGVDMEYRHRAGDHACKQEGAPIQPLADRQPDQHERDQREAEPEQGRALRHEVGEHGIEPLKVVVAIERVLAWQVLEDAQAATPNVPDEVEKAESAAEQEHEDGDRRRNATPGEPQRREVQHRRKRETEQPAGQHQRRGQAAPEWDQVGREEIDHEGVAEVIAGVDGKLRREVVRVGERSGE